MFAVMLCFSRQPGLCQLRRSFACASCCELCGAGRGGGERALAVLSMRVDAGLLGTAPPALFSAPFTERACCTCAAPFLLWHDCIVSSSAAALMTLCGGSVAGPLHCTP